ncbi:ATP cone domain-containing protein, partial [Clostridium botulinum]
MITIKKKNGQIEDFDFQKIVDAVSKSAERVNIILNKEFKDKLHIGINKIINVNNLQDNVINVSDMHEIVQESLKDINNEVYKEYMSFRDYKKRFSKIFSNLLESSHRIIYDGDKENANKNSLLVSTKKGILV